MDLQVFYRKYVVFYSGKKFLKRSKQRAESSMHKNMNDHMMSRKMFCLTRFEDSQWKSKQNNVYDKDHQAQRGNIHRASGCRDSLSV